MIFTLVRVRYTYSSVPLLQSLMTGEALEVCNMTMNFSVQFFLGFEREVCSPKGKAVKGLIFNDD